MSYLWLVVWIKVVVLRGKAQIVCAFSLSCSHLGKGGEAVWWLIRARVGIAKWCVYVTVCVRGTALSALVD